MTNNMRPRTSGMRRVEKGSKAMVLIASADAGLRHDEREAINVPKAGARRYCIKDQCCRNFYPKVKEVYMRKLTLAASIVVALFLVNASHAQFGKSAGPKFYGSFKPVVGAWSEYQVSTKGEPSSKMKIAIVGKEGDAYWYESVMQSKEGQMVSKMLVSGNPEEKKNIQRMVFKMGDQPAMEMPIQMMMQKPGGQEQRGKMIDRGSESIKVPAGTFTAQHMQYQDGEILVDSWLHKDVSPYGIIKSQTKEVETVLLAYGTGAKTLITETPKKFEMPQVPMMPPKSK
jgi:hypothetical protein